MESPLMASLLSIFVAYVFERPCRGGNWAQLSLDETMNLAHLYIYIVVPLFIDGVVKARRERRRSEGKQSAERARTKRSPRCRGK